MTEDREKAFRKRIAAFPSHFDLDIKFGFTTGNRKNIIKKLSEEMETTAFNVLSFLHWRIGDHKQAKVYSEKALLKRQDDVMALANQTWMHMKRSEFSETVRELIVISKAEQAFAYTRLGPRYFKKAIELFQNVIASSTELELEETYINLWKFGLGLSLKRQLHFVNAFSFDHLSTPVDSFTYAIRVLLDVAQNANTHRYKARGLVALGELADSIHNHDMLSSQDKNSLPKEFADTTPDEFFDTALNIFHDDVYVLERYGRHVIFSRDYNKSIQFLRRSVDIRGTSLGHHHLAKAIRSALNKELGDFHNTSNRQIFYTPVSKGCDEGYKKFLENQIPDEICLDKDKLPGNNGVFENSPVSVSSTNNSTAPELASRGSIQNDSGIFSLKTTYDLTAQFDVLKMSDSASSSYPENMVSPELQPRASNTYCDADQARAVEQRQTSNTFDNGHRARIVEQQASNTFIYGNQARFDEQRKTSNTFSDDDQARVVERDQMISNQRYNPSSVGDQKGQMHTAYRRCDSENSFSDRGYRSMRASYRGRTRGAQGSRFGARRGRGQTWVRSQSSDQLFPRSKKFQNLASMSEEIISRQISSPGGQCTPENQSFTTPFQPQQRKVTMPIGSPQKVLRYPPNDKRVEEILHHLEKSLEYAPSNCAAFYDKGLLFRSLGRLHDAVELFIDIRTQKDCSPWQAVLCMEQHALYDQREALNTNIKELLFEAMDKAAYIASLVPFYQPRGTAFPSLKEMLLRQDKGNKYYKTTLKEFARLYELIGKYGHALSFYTKISEMSDTDAKDPEIILKMAQNYVKQRDFRNSLLFFNLIETSCTRLVDENRKLYFEAYLEGALCALEQDNAKEAKSRFKRTVRFCSQRKMISEDDDEEEEGSYDIHIQTSRDAEKSGLKLFDLLTNTCGLKVSLNDNQTTEELKYEGIYEGVGNIMEQSCLIVLIINDASLRKGDLRYFINVAVDLNVDSNLGTGIISICLGTFNVPVEIKTFPAFIQPQHLDISEKKHENFQWLRNFFWKATEQTLRLSMPNDTDRTDSDSLL
ncbi:hypothetical protein ACJMK2_016244 [Sinanodonta woodiana]|uniref:Tetratricopeptide repeat protein n=1 Tax=Sinanodonta woodiana TaxID=1069815 RepID=A0ABD3UUD4_SINWO